MFKLQRIQVFEHQALCYGNEYEGVLFKKSHFEALVKLNDYHNNKYFTVLHKSIRFSQYVGVIQVNGLCIEVLPKADNNENNKAIWQGVLIDMLRHTKRLKVDNVGNANVTKQNIHLLDIYFEWFLNEVQLLIHQGLIKKYYKQTKNVKALKGKLEFAGHIQKNLIHKERFYTSHQVYDKDHQIHQILFKTLKIIEHFSKNANLYNKCKIVQLDFPEVSNINITASTFTKIPLSRKNAPYKVAIELARLIILNYAPNIIQGSEKMLALLFDMNVLWEEYVLVSLKKYVIHNKGSIEVYGQQSKVFWGNIAIRPDIVIKKEGQIYIIDTKWKHINGHKPSTNDLRQMYVYNEFWESKKSLLLYPCDKTISPSFISFQNSKHKCALGQLNIIKDTKLNTEMAEEIIGWFDKADSIEFK